MNGAAPAKRRKVGIIVTTFDDDYDGMAGGYVHFFEAAKRWHDFDLVFYAPEMARKTIARNLPQAEFVPIASCDDLTKNRALLFGYRMVAASFSLPRRLRELDAIYPLTHFVADVLPAVLAAPGRTAAQVHHLQDLPWKRPGGLFHNMLAYVNEALGVALIRQWIRSVVVVNRLVEKELHMPSRARVFLSGNGTWTIPVEHAALPPERRAGVVFVGRFHPTKAIDELIEAWALVAACVPGAHLSLIGTGDPAYVAQLEASVERLHIASSVTFTGLVSNERKAQLIGSARVFATATKEEGFGIAAAEAMALGTPCATYALPVFEEVFPHGRLSAPVGDVAGLAEAIVRLLVDEALFLRLAGEARELGASLSWDHVARVEERAILEVAR
jgi:glycosyltransferase involved in cell wall biosynthesis